MRDIRRFAQTQRYTRSGSPLLTISVAGLLSLSCSSSSSGPQSECTFSPATIVTPAGADASGLDVAENSEVRVFLEAPFSLCTAAEIAGIRLNADADVHEIATAAEASETVTRKVTYDGLGSPTVHPVITMAVDVVGAGPGQTTVRLSFTHPRIEPPADKSFTVRVQ